MKAFVISGPRQAGVEDVDPPSAGPGEVVIDVARAGICGTDVEFYTGGMQYLHDGNASYPIRIGHEWMGTVSAIGEDVDATWLGRRVTGDTMLGCGECRRCRTGYHHVCEFRTELGIRGGRPGALAEQLAFPSRYLHALPDSVTDTAGALVEPGGNAWRSVEAAGLREGDRVLILGPGTIGLLSAMFARAVGAGVHLMGRSGRSLEFARTFEFDGVWTEHELPALRWDAVIDSSNASHLPAKALELVEPGKRIVHVGLAGSPSLIDTRMLALGDITAVGILGASAGLAPTIRSYASATVDPTPLIAATIALDDLAGVLAGDRPSDAAAGPKIHVEISRPSGGEQEDAR
jgi:threonine dehydrogenase-like Zn-dependent dehydrogenase